ncbi:MAG: TIGR03000 domain-containing protein [Gemmataceae bacterium]
MLRRLIPVLTIATVVLVLVESVSAGPLDRLRSRRDTRRDTRNNTVQQQDQMVSTQQPGVYRSYYRVTSPDVPQQSVLLNVQVPSDAKVEINGEQTEQSGSYRTFVTPALTQGKTYNVTVKASWSTSSGQVTKTQKLQCQAGETFTVNMMQVQQQQQQQQQN